MDIYKCITTRRSIRKFKDKNIDKDELYLLVEAGMHAPTAGNLQHIRFVVTFDEELIKKISDACMNQEWISTAKGVIVICSQPEKVKEWYGLKGESIFAIQDAALAAQNILLAATDIGLGACFISGFEQDKMDDLIGVGSDARVEIVIPVGYPDEVPDKKTISDFDSVVFFDKYGNNKSNLTLLNKDYSIIMEKSLKKGQEKAQTLAEKGKEFLTKQFEEIKQKVKENDYNKDKSKNEKVKLK
jgi:nitroreductase